jgi:putative ABC transport system permease protein
VNASGSILSWSRLRRTIRLGLKSLWLHRLRSLLTVLGIVFGVCSVIAMLAIGEGASFEAQEQIKSLGSQNIILRSVKPPEEEKPNNSQANYVLDYGITYADLRRIQQTIPGVSVVVPARVMREYVWNLQQRTDCEVTGTVPWYPEMRNHPVAQGRFFTDYEMDARENVCVLGENMARSLFPITNPLGERVRVGGAYYKVIGVMSPRITHAELGEQRQGGGGGPDKMFIPLETARERFGEILMKRRSGSFESERIELHELTVQVNRLQDVMAVSEAIQEVMARNHRKKDYDVVVPLELLKRAERTKRVFNIVLGSIAAISLLVGGIGIMNIMLASVTERTREIGIRRALGAKRRDIVVQFLVESVILSAAGGVLGIMLGLVIPFMVTYISEMKTIVTPLSPVLAFTISGIVGIIFGIYPAVRAAEMDPVEALRHE